MQGGIPGQSGEVSSVTGRFTMSSPLKRLNSATGTVALGRRAAGPVRVGSRRRLRGRHDRYQRHPEQRDHREARSRRTPSRPRRSRTTPSRPEDQGRHDHPGRHGGQRGPDARRAGERRRRRLQLHQRQHLIPGVSAATYRKDRFGEVHLTGPVVGPTAPVATATATTPTRDSSPMPSRSCCRRATSRQRHRSFERRSRPVDHRRGRGLHLTQRPRCRRVGGRQLPRHRRPPALLDGVSFEAAGSSVVIAKMKASGRGNGSLLESLSLS